MTLLNVTRVLASVLLLAGASNAYAYTTDFGDFSAELGATSDYRHRGISRSDESPAVQGGIDYKHSSGIYAGVFASNIDLNDGNEAKFETQLHAGYQFDVNAAQFDAEVRGYLYPGADNVPRDYDYLELVGRGRFNASFADFEVETAFSPNYFRESGESFYLGGRMEAPIRDSGFTVNGAYGYQWLSKEVRFGTSSDYANWSLGLGYDWNGFDLEAAYVDTDVNDRQCRYSCDATGIFSVTKEFD